MFFHISLKYSNLGITPVKITEILLEDLVENIDAKMETLELKKAKT